MPPALKQNVPLTDGDWASCASVLQSLIGDSQTVGDSDRSAIERLVARLYKKVRKERRKQTAKVRRQHDRRLVEESGRFGGLTGSALPIDRNDIADAPRPGPRRLKARSRVCYICKEKYRDVDTFYHWLCPPCAQRNHVKREQRACLDGRQALVTGGRIKIGYQTALKLLRDGARVIVTTRFAKDAAMRFASESDVQQWQQRLQICALDFLDIRGVLSFVEHLLTTMPSLEILINNAAQSVRRPEKHYAALRMLEAAPLPLCSQSLLGPSFGTPRVTCEGPRQIQADGATAELPGITMRVATDLNGLLVDRREHNSWTARLGEVDAAEFLEVLLINVNVPFLLASRLKPLLQRSSFSDRYIINVTGLDGRFGRGFKSALHPHISMSKAALNMMTRTSAADYVQEGILMNSVDTGWITHEGAHSKRERMRSEGFMPPLDEVDGAARIYDPIVCGLRGHPQFGKMFRHYQPVLW